VRFEVKSGGVPTDLRSMIIEADNENDAVFRAGILIGKGLRRRARQLNQGFWGLSCARVHSARPTDKPLPAMRAHNPDYSREQETA
jgi:hypothetical protein